MLESLRLNRHDGVKSISQFKVLDLTSLNQDKVISRRESQKVEFSDEALMAAYANGNLVAFEQLYGRHKDPLLRYFLRQVSQKAIAEELFQETWQSLIKNSKNYKSSAKFSTYLYTIAHSRLVDFYRKHSRQDWQSYDDENNHLELEAEVETQPERQLDVAELEQHLLQSLQILPAAQQEVFILKFEAGMSVPEIAEALGENPEAIKSRLRYGIAKLKGCFKRSELKR